MISPYSGVKAFMLCTTSWYLESRHVSRWLTLFVINSCNIAYSCVSIFSFQLIANFLRPRGWVFCLLISLGVPYSLGHTESDGQLFVSRSER